MSKVTSKLQVTLPKTIADSFGIRPGDDIDWEPAGDVIRVVPKTARTNSGDLSVRLRIFDQATERHRQRTKEADRGEPRTRGWKREDLYTRGRTR